MSADSVPGRYESPFDDFPGHIQFPYPVTLPQFKAWWETAVQGAKKIELTDYALFECEWQAARDLLLNYGEWQIAGIPIGHVKDGHVHLGVAAWVIERASEHMTPFLPPKQRLVWSTLTSQIAVRAVNRGS